MFHLSFYTEFAHDVRGRRKEGYLKWEWETEDNLKMHTKYERLRMGSFKCSLRGEKKIM